MTLCPIERGYLTLGRSGIEEVYMQSWRLCLRFFVNLSSRVWRARKSNNLLQGSSIWYYWHSLQCTSNHKGLIYCAKPLINIWLHQFCISSFLNQIHGPIFQGFLMNSVNIRGFLMNSINSKHEWYARRMFVDGVWWMGNKWCICDGAWGMVIGIKP